MNRERMMALLERELEQAAAALRLVEDYADALGVHELAGRARDAQAALEETDR